MSTGSYGERAAAKRQLVADQQRLRRWSRRRNLLFGWMSIWVLIFLISFAATIPI